jgi:uncharacterized protein (DUF433 family)
MRYKDRIIQNPNIMVGKPVIKGTRIPVERILAHLARNTDLDDLFGAYPELTIEDVHASLEYAYTLVHRHQSRPKVKAKSSASASKA